MAEDGSCEGTRVLLGIPFFFFFFFNIRFKRLLKEDRSSTVKHGTVEDQRRKTVWGHGQSGAWGSEFLGGT